MMEGSLGMKHFFRFFAAAACTVLLLALCACTPDGTSSPVSSSATEGVSSESAAQSIPAPESASGEGAQALSLLPADAANIQPDAVPEFLTADQQELYRAAYYLYYHFDVSSGFAFDTIDENSPFIVGDTGRSYYQDTGFANYSAFRTALDCVFTSNFADSLIDKYQNYIKGDDGLLYFSFGDRGGNIFYKSSEFSQISETADEIRFQLIGHYDEAGPGGSASSSPYTETCEVKLLNTENGWRFAGFAMAY